MASGFSRAVPPGQRCPARLSRGGLASGGTPYDTGGREMPLQPPGLVLPHLISAADGSPGANLVRRRQPSGRLPSFTPEYSGSRRTLRPWPSVAGFGPARKVEFLLRPPRRRRRQPRQLLGVFAPRGHPVEPLKDRAHTRKAFHGEGVARWRARFQRCESEVGAPVGFRRFALNFPFSRGNGSGGHFPRIGGIKSRHDPLSDTTLSPSSPPLEQSRPVSPSLTWAARRLSASGNFPKTMCRKMGLPDASGQA